MAGFRDRISSQPETLQDFELAAEQRYWEGVELALAGWPLGAVYLMGYCSEILLKLACFRLDRISTSSPVSGCFGPARQWMRTYCPSVDAERYHSLHYWMRLLRHKRRSYGQALAEDLDRQLIGCVRRLYQTWWVEMRYRGDALSVNEVNQVYNDVSWLRDHYLSLWR